MCQATGLHLQRENKFENILLKSKLRTHFERWKVKVTMLYLSDSFVLFMDEPIQLCTSPLYVKIN